MFCVRSSFQDASCFERAHASSWRIPEEGTALFNCAYPLLVSSFAYIDNCDIVFLTCIAVACDFDEILCNKLVC